MGTLYLIATPIGNLEDISARALRLLNEVAYIAAEDTRQTRKLLSHFGIHTPVTSYHEHNKQSKIGFVLEQLASGDVGLVSDAGTPNLNDPGYELVRAALDAGYAVSPIPGACAPVAALIASGLPTDAFLYLGYLPRKSAERRRSLAEIAHLPYSLVFLESPHRLVASLEDLLAILGNRQVAVARVLGRVGHEGP
ncbi:MAG: 16S rRNA (cytidine(1402)-2'-O)-methyltransferase, partial [Anaerolineales bacterium]